MAVRWTVTFAVLTAWQDTNTGTATTTPEPEPYSDRNIVVLAE